MKLSKFNLWVEDYPASGDYLLFNSRTQALIKVNQELKEDLDALRSSKFEVRSSKLTENLAALKENGIIVEDEGEEEEKLKDFFRQLKYESDNLPFEATILTTYSCNFKCVYCFEESVKESVFLDEETSDLVVKWLTRHAETEGLKKIFLVFYGGEPLLNVKPVYHISGRLKKWADERGVAFGLAIITNGSLVNLDLVDRLLPLGLKEIRISIDGEREAHNRNRPFLDGSPTFDIILDNIRRVIDKVNVGIAGNFDRRNLDSIPRLLDYLEEEGLLRKFSRVDFAPLAPRLGPKMNPGQIELSECLSFFDKDGLFKEVIHIKKELLKRGLKAPTGLAINACSMIMQDAGVTIDPKGIIYNCNSFLGHPEFSIGDVHRDEFNDNFERFLNIDAWNKCPKDCPYVPMCQGGCRFFSYLENKDLSGLACKREYLDRIIPDLIKLEYDKLSSGK